MAAAHCQHLTSSRAVTQHVMDAVDVIVGSPRALPKPLEAMLFQNDTPGVDHAPKRISLFVAAFIAMSPHMLTEQDIFIHAMPCALLVLWKLAQDGSEWSACSSPNAF